MRPIAPKTRSVLAFTCSAASAGLIQMHHRRSSSSQQESITLSSIFLILAVLRLEEWRGYRQSLDATEYGGRRTRGGGRDGDDQGIKTPLNRAMNHQEIRAQGQQTSPGRARLDLMPAAMQQQCAALPCL